jgi:KipI family sensor histidine kinase inhibitor
VRDGALLVEYPEPSEEDANRAAVSLSRRLAALPGGGVLDAIPGARTVLVVFDPARFSRRRLEEEIARRAPETDGGAARLFRFPAVYDGEDLPELARAAGLAPEELARRHASAEYRVAFIGFSPGFPYLTGLPPELSAPRLPEPRPRVAPGSIAIGGPYTGVYPSATPGGWRLIGRTSARLFEEGAQPPSLLAPGDRVRFEVVRALIAPVAPPERATPRSPVLRLLSPGLFTSVQGAPRYGLGSSGIPAGGAMDLASLAMANAVVGNAPGAPALEVTVLGPDLQTLSPCVVALAGADIEAEVNGRSVSVGEAIALAAGDRLRLGRARGGVRVYLAARGGLEAPRLTKRMEAGEGVAAGSEAASRPSPTRATRTPRPVETLLRLVAGPQTDHFGAGVLERFLATSWRVSPVSDRRGLRLEGPGLEHAREPQIPPEGAVAGSIQVPGGGLPIVLGPDGPVTGGYPKLATIIAADLPLLGQARPGARLRFTEVSLADALAARREYD